jgi:hypothetical protein
MKKIMGDIGGPSITLAQESIYDYEEKVEWEETQGIL